MAGIVTGYIDEGIASLRRAIEIAREDDDIDGTGTAYANLADTLSLAGRTNEALETAKEGLAAVSGRVPRPHDWMSLTVSDLSFEAGDWKAAREYLTPDRTQLAGRHLIFRHIREAEFALGVGDLETAARCLEAAEPLVAQSSEPQWIGAFGTLQAELLRRRYDLAGARAAVANALDRMELCTDDVMRIARVTAAPECGSRPTSRSAPAIYASAARSATRSRGPGFTCSDCARPRKRADRSRARGARWARRTSRGPARGATPSCG